MVTRWAVIMANWYVFVIEPELEGEMLSLVQCSLRTVELYVPKSKIIGGQEYFHFAVIFLNRFELFL